MKIKIIIPENASFQGYFTEVSFDISEENQLSYFQNGYFFKILLGFHEPYNQVKCRLKNKIYFLNFSLMKNNEIDSIFYIESEYMKRIVGGICEGRCMQISYSHLGLFPAHMITVYEMDSMAVLYLCLPSKKAPMIFFKLSA